MSKIIGEKFSALGEYYTVVSDGFGKIENYDEAYSRICKKHLAVLKENEKLKKVIFNYIEKEYKKMKKIPTLFKKDYEKGKFVGVEPVLNGDFDWVLRGEGEATLKVDGSCCAVIGGEYYKRYDAKKGKTPPAGAIPCQEAPDPITGHWPHWVKLSESEPGDKWYLAAFNSQKLPDGTYEAIGPHFQGNPYGLTADTIYVHGSTKLPDFPRDFEGMRKYLSTHEIEGVVFWKDGEPKCKIKRSDFGYKWNKK